MIHDEYDGWTPKLVADQFCDALRWVRRSTGPVGPAGIRSGQPAYIATLEEFMEDFGLPETADDEEELRPSYPLPSPEQVTRHLDALEWARVYLIPHHEGSARMLGLWAMCKITRRPFDKAVKARGLPRHAAYALRDRALSLISQGLQRDGVKP